MNKVKAVAVLVMACALAAVAVLSSCSCSQQSSSSSSKSEKPEVSTEASVSSSTSISKDPFYLLIVGNDSRTGTSEIGKEQYADGTARSDTIMLTRVDPTTHKITLVTIPRDTKAYLEDGSPYKINETYHQSGMDGLLKAVEDLTGVRPKYYLDTTFVGFEDIVNAIGGISMYVPFNQSMDDIVSGNLIEFPAGDQTLDGAQALVFARERKAYGRAGASNEEACRQTNDRAIMRTIMQKIMAAGDGAEALVKATYPFVKTNMSLEELTAYVKDFTANSGQVSFLDGTGPYDGDVDGEAGVWLATRDEDTWREIIAVVDRGEDPNTVLQAPSI